MEITDLSAIEQDSLLRTLNYCVAQWDWESPTLFSLEQSDFQALISTWPQCIALQEKTAALAVVGGLREILYGASAVKSEAVAKLIGISHSEACALLNRLLPRIDRALGQDNAV